MEPGRAGGRRRGRQGSSQTTHDGTTDSWSSGDSGTGPEMGASCRPLHPPPCPPAVALCEGYTATPLLYDFPLFRETETCAKLSPGSATSWALEENTIRSKTISTSAWGFGQNQHNHLPTFGTRLLIFEGKARTRDHFKVTEDLLWINLCVCQGALLCPSVTKNKPCGKIVTFHLL